MRGLIALRRRHATLTCDHVLGHRHYLEALVDGVAFHGVKQYQPDWSHTSHSLAIHFQGLEGDVGLYLIANAYSEPLSFELPRQMHWKRVIDTSLPSPEDLVAEEDAEAVSPPTCRVAAQSVVVLIEDKKPGHPR